MNTFTVAQLKDALIELYSRKDALGMKAYRIAFDLLEEKMGEDEFDAFLDACGI